MKPIPSLLAIAVLCGSSILATAQQPPNPPTNGKEPDKAKSADWKQQREFIEGLPEDVRKRFKEAREEAMQDPKIKALHQKVEAASKELRDAIRQSIAEKDPTLATQIADRMKTHSNDSKNKEKKSRPEGGPESGIQKVPPAERDRLEAARQIAKQAPAVQSAEAAMKSAETPEARREAGKNFQKAMRDAILTVDPSLADVLDQMKSPKPVMSPAPAQSPAMEQEQ
jgi:hypothetical protein